MRMRVFVTGVTGVVGRRLVPLLQTIPPVDRVDIVDALYRFGAGQDLHDRALFDSAFSATDTTHTITNPRVIAFDGVRATLFALVEAQHLLHDDHSRHLLLKNIYTCALSKQDERWLIDRMQIENVWMTGDPSVLFDAERVVHERAGHR